MPVLLSLVLPVFSARALTLDTLEHWTGSGSNRAALIIDWHDGTLPHALAWGFCFNGTTTADALIGAVAGANSNLVLTRSGNNITSISYHRSARPGDILPGTGNHPSVRWTAYTWDHTNTIAGAWSLWRGNGNTFATTNMTRVTTSLPATTIFHGDWFALSFSPDGTGPQPPTVPAAALHYPFGSEVIAYNDGGDDYKDIIDRKYYTNPTNALGRPTVDTTGDGTIPISSVVPVVPVYPAFRSYEMVTIGVKASGGELILAFDHPVFDNPDNPYGADFIVFGNAFQIIGNGAYWHNGDPNGIKNGGAVFAEGGDIEVSQDGATWHLISILDEGDDPNYDRTADSFAPTLGRVYDTNRTDTALGEWNKWWGGATDPTIPVDPSIFAPDIKGMTVAGIARRYRGSAGGTAFDINPLPLARDPVTGMKWIQYLRITPSWGQTPEVDAIADVSPALPADLWRTTVWPGWLDDPADEADSADPDGDGVPNLMEYALGRAPLFAENEPPFNTETAPGGNAFIFTHSVNPDAHGVTLGIVKAGDLTGAEWTTNGVRTTLSPDGATATSEVPFSGKQGFMRLRATHEK